MDYFKEELQNTNNSNFDVFVIESFSSQSFERFTKMDMASLTVV